MREKEKSVCVGWWGLEIIISGGAHVVVSARTHRLIISLVFFFLPADYYLINSVTYDCYLYARYFHGESWRVLVRMKYCVCS